MPCPAHWAAFVIVLFSLAPSLIQPAAALRLDDGPAVPPATAEATVTAGGAAYLPILINQPLPAPSPTATATPSPPDQSPQEQAIVTRINAERAARDLPPLAVAPELIQAARRHSRDMAEHHLTGHIGSDGSTPGQRIREAGYNWSTENEIIGWGFADPEAMVAWWMNDKLHREIVLSTAYKDLGVGYVTEPSSDWIHYWTVDFGSRASGEMEPQDALWHAR
ncbi:MAG: CAP domain-containing protein [Ardenticatenaceae bacterium]|nr:CAP domain-containing protein [Ardenticatenaceae bacterium]